MRAAKHLPLSWFFLALWGLGIAAAQQPAHPIAGKLPTSPLAAAAAASRTQAAVTPSNFPATTSAASARLTVSYEGGLLRVDAHGASLREVLDAIGAKTGGNVDSSVDTGTAVVTVSLGPGEPADVVGALLYGTAWNYAILSSASNPHALDRIVLMPKNESASPAMAAATSAAAPADAGAGEAKAAPKGDPKTQVAKETTEPAKDAQADKKAPKSEKDAVAAGEKEGAQEADKQDPSIGDLAAAQQAIAILGGKPAQDPNLGNREVGGTGGASFPSKLYNLYPGLFGGSRTPSPEALAAAAQGGSSSYPGAATGTGGQTAQGIPSGMSDFPPSLWKIYPPNLLDLVRNPVVLPPVQALPVIQPGSLVLPAGNGILDPALAAILSGRR